MKLFKFILLTLLAVGFLGLTPAQAAKADSIQKPIPATPESLHTAPPDSTVVVDSLALTVKSIANQTKRTSTLLLFSLVIQLALLAGLVYFMFVGVKKLKIKQAPQEPRRPKEKRSSDQDYGNFDWDGK